MNIVILAGYSCAGKTTIGRIFGEKYSTAYINQQSIYRDISEKKGYKQARDWLADMGVNEFINETMDGVIERIKGLNEPETVLIDEVYNLESVRKIEESFPESKLAIIKVSVSDELRSMRMSERPGRPQNMSPDNELEFRDDFLRTAGLDEVLSKCNFEVHNTGFAERAVDELATKLIELGFPL